MVEQAQQQGQQMQRQNVLESKLKALAFRYFLTYTQDITLQTPILIASQDLKATMVKVHNAIKSGDMALTDGGDGKTPIKALIVVIPTDDPPLAKERFSKAMEIFPFVSVAPRESDNQDPGN